MDKWVYFNGVDNNSPQMLVVGNIILDGDNYLFVKAPKNILQEYGILFQSFRTENDWGIGFVHEDEIDFTTGLRIIK